MASKDGASSSSSSGNQENCSNEAGENKFDDVKEDEEIEARPHTVQILVSTLRPRKG